MFLRTRYYSADIPVWIDETSSPREWKADFLSPEAADVVRAVGAWIIVFRKGAQLSGRSEQDEAQQDNNGGGDLQEKEVAKQLMQAVQDIIRNAHDEEEVWDGTCLVVGMPGSSWKVQAPRNEVEQDESISVKPDELPKPLDIQGEGDDKARAQEEWEDSCLDLGFEYVDGSVGRDAGTNEFGERQGTARILEALEANEWEPSSGLDDDIDLDDLFEMGEFQTAADQDSSTKIKKDRRGNGACQTGDEGFNMEASQMESEFASLKGAVRGVNGSMEEDGVDKEAMEVEELEKMMLKMTAVRGMFEDSLIFRNASRDSAPEENADINSRYERPYAGTTTQTPRCKDSQ